jgi:hypothetical protein
MKKNNAMDAKIITQRTQRKKVKRGPQMNMEITTREIK